MITNNRINIVFDLDGTILDSSIRHYIVLKEILNEKNILLNPVDLIDYKRQGVSTMQYLVHKGIGKESEEINKLWVKHIEDEKYLKLDIIYPDAQKVLKLLKYHNLFLITARGNKTAAINQIKRLGLNHIFNKYFVVNNRNNVGPRKASLLSKYKIDYIIGDTENDLECAKQLSAQFFMLNRGFRNKKFWDNLKLISYPNLESIYNIIKQSL